MTQTTNKSSTKRFLEFIKPEKNQFYLLALCSVISNILVTSMPFIMGVAIDDLLKAIKEANGAILTASFIQEIIIFPVVILIIIAVVSAFFSYVQERIMASLSEDVTLRLRKEITQKFKRLPMSFFDSHQVGDILSRTTNDINRIAEMLLTGINQLFSSIVNIIFGLLMLLYIDLKLTGIVVILIVFSSVVTTWVANKNKTLADRNQHELGILNNQAEEYFSGNLEIKTFNQQKQTATQIDQTNKKHQKAFEQSQFFDFAIYPAIRFLNQLAFIVSAIIGAGLVIQGSLTIGLIQAYLQYVNQISEPITNFSYVINTIQSAMASFDRVLYILDQPEERLEPEIPLHINDSQGEIQFKGVKFGYTPDNLLMNDVSFTAKSHKMIAIVGPTGAGKTTLVNLLMRFYEINGGVITYDGQDITGLTRQDLRSKFGMVLQNTWLFEGTVANNIAYGNKQATREEIIQAAQIAQCDHFIRTLPDGYDTIISSENGSLSQGQQQLLTIARVVLANPPVVILDEATSSVDTRTEAEIQTAMESVTKGRTSFVIAHRLSTIEKADLILVMDAGDIVEQGNHQELLNKKGLYRTLYQSQFKDS
ncbi:ABC transporter ATP-binding protein [Vagococcus carniphilus]|uniref:ABC transporter ATP-binding protein n=1 Tax=Vagococcus carniphilus TaxID=218144 RepID=A0AAW8U4P7_9ENTE|nr:ABC transporter ATP-binding protein [Vagococcus carniphilus]MDT2834508.1 ABC transporter ATP-binding protein [Vagococcus carniphilus]